MNKWLLYIFIAALTTIVTGCFGPSGPDTSNTDVLGGRSNYSGLAYLVAATVSISGDVNQSTTTDELGNYSFRSLPNDTYTLSISTVTGSNSWQVNIDGDTVFNPSFPLPSGFDRDYFRAIINVRPWVSDGNGGIQQWGWDLPTQRWRRGRTVSVYYDTANAAAGCSNDWVTITRDELGTWQSVLGGSIALSEVSDDSSARLLVHCVADGTFGAGVIGYGPSWSGYELAEDGSVPADIPRDSPYTEYARLYVVESYSSNRAVIAHELAHVMGLGHVANSSSMMYPYITGADTLNSIEITYAKMLYSIGSGVIVPASGSVSQVRTNALSLPSGGRAIVIYDSGHINLDVNIPSPSNLSAMMRH